MQSIFARGVYLGENTSQSASVEFVRPLANKLCARQTASLLSKKGFALFGQSQSASGLFGQRRFVMCAA